MAAVLMARPLNSDTLTDSSARYAGVDLAQNQLQISPDGHLLMVDLSGMSPSGVFEILQSGVEYKDSTQLGRDYFLYIDFTVESRPRDLVYPLRGKVQRDDLQPDFLRSSLNTDYARGLSIKDQEPRLISASPSHGSGSSSVQPVYLTFDIPVQVPDDAIVINYYGFFNSKIPSNITLSADRRTMILHGILQPNALNTVLVAPIGMNGIKATRPYLISIET